MAGTETTETGSFNHRGQTSFTKTDRQIGYISLLFIDPDHKEIAEWCRAFSHFFFFLWNVCNQIKTTHKAYEKSSWYQWLMFTD